MEIYLTQIVRYNFSHFPNKLLWSLFRLTESQAEVTSLRQALDQAKYETSEKNKETMSAQVRIMTPLVIFKWLRSLSPRCLYKKTCAYFQNVFLFLGGWGFVHFSFLKKKIKWTRIVWPNINLLFSEIKILFCECPISSSLLCFSNCSYKH